jgi:hypothetical protein
MLTSADIQFEPATQKITLLSNSVIMMTAGDAGVQGELTPIRAQTLASQWPGLIIIERPGKRPLWTWAG